MNTSTSHHQYIHVPAKDHYEHGHKRGNEHHFIERHEKGHPHAGEFKTKVRWGDKHGGYGEHYWDFNHAGHDDGDGEESQQSESYEEYPDESKQVVTYETETERRKRNPDDDVEFINDKARALIVDSKAPRHGGNYRRAKEYRTKREPETPNPSHLVYDGTTGMIVDQLTGRKYYLQAVQN